MSGLAETSAEAEPASGSARERISVTIVALNEAENIGTCLASVSWADELVVVDAGSADGTQAICREHGAVVVQHPWEGYAQQKNFALTQVRHSWVLSLDADERVTPELSEEILRALSAAAPADGYRIPRKNVFFGRWLRHGDLWPDHQLRLFRRVAGAFGERSVHESVLVEGRVETLSGPIEHYSYRDLSDFVQRQAAYARLSAQDAFEGGARPSPGDFLLRPLWRFFRSYVLRMGFRDGAAGLWVSLGSAWYVFMRAAFLWELRRGHGRP